MKTAENTIPFQMIDNKKNKEETKKQDNLDTNKLKLKHQIEIETKEKEIQSLKELLNTLKTLHHKQGQVQMVQPVKIQPNQSTKNDEQNMTRTQIKSQIKSQIQKSQLKSQAKVIDLDDLEKEIVENNKQTREIKQSHYTNNDDNVSKKSMVSEKIRKLEQDPLPKPSKSVLKNSTYSQKSANKRKRNSESERDEDDNDVDADHNVVYNKDEANKHKDLFDQFNDLKKGFSKQRSSSTRKLLGNKDDDVKWNFEKGEKKQILRQDQQQKHEFKRRNSDSTEIKEAQKITKYDANKHKALFNQLQNLKAGFSRQSSKKDLKVTEKDEEKDSNEEDERKSTKNYRKAKSLAQRNLSDDSSDFDKNPVEFVNSKKKVEQQSPRQRRKTEENFQKEKKKTKAQSDESEESELDTYDADLKKKNQYRPQTDKQKYRNNVNNENIYKELNQEISDSFDLHDNKNDIISITLAQPKKKFQKSKNNKEGSFKNYQD